MPKPLLTARQVVFLRLIAEGHTDRAIGRKFEVSEFAVRQQISGAMGRLGAKNRGHAVVLAYRAGLIT